MVTLSIIIPIYNGEKFINKCLDSIFHSQNKLDSFEVIIVDDGSPDNSIAIIERYCRLFENITIFSQDNKGLGEARNSGMKLAKGEYIWFVDQDDWITDGAISRINNIIILNKPEILFFDYTYPSGNKSAILNNGINGKTYSGSEFLNTHVVENPVWQYVIKADHILKYKLKFHSDYHEDSLFTPIVLFLASTIFYDNNVNYIYNLREGSITTSSYPYKHCIDILKVVDKLNQFKNLQSKNNLDKKIISKYISIIYFSIYYYWRKLSKKEKINISNSLSTSLFYELILNNFKLKDIIKFVRIKCIKLI